MGAHDESSMSKRRERPGMGRLFEFPVRQIKEEPVRRDADLIRRFGDYYLYGGLMRIDPACFDDEGWWWWSDAS
jgi:hypothetical protein